jgi:hypothetical protein
MRRSKSLSELIDYYENLSKNGQNNNNKYNKKENKDNDDDYLFDMDKLETTPRQNKIIVGGRRKKNGNNDITEQSTEILPVNRKFKRPPTLLFQSKKFFYCTTCKIIFDKEDNYNEHIIKHQNESENSACYCRKCGTVFENDIVYYNHAKTCKISEITEKIEDIPIDPNGKYECPTCHQKYANTYYLGEHFILSHNDYNILCTLDEKYHNGFPGFQILFKIEMIENIRVDESQMCEICYFNYVNNEDDVESNEIKEDNRAPLQMYCCKRLICYDCIMNHIIASDSIICPYCRKDHTRTDWDYITFVDMINNTDRDKWIPWWEEHLDIFSFCSHFADAKFRYAQRSNDRNA